jgi:2-polyprenyl-3-methyl-5-hydroxy-6-metoxy-1,4-benzoquinol methylase
MAQLFRRARFVWERAVRHLLAEERRSAQRPRSRMQAVFTALYRAGEAQGPSAGAPSEGARRAVAGWVAGLRVATLLDAGCGDFDWLSDLALPGVDYLGVDVVEEVIAFNRAAHGRPGRSFQVADLTVCSLPRADLVLCRDCLVHLPCADALRVLARVKDSGSAYLAATTYPEVAANADVALGGWRPLNLEQAPFHLPRPLELSADEGPAGRMLGLWRLAGELGAR